MVYEWPGVCTTSGMSKSDFYNMVIVSPGDPRIWKIRISRTAVAILAVAFLLSFCVTVAVGHTVAPEKLSNAEHLKLQAENQTLEVANKNAEIRNGKIERDLKEIEVLSYRLNALMKAN